MDKALQTMIDNMPEKTGKSLDEWTKHLKTKKFEKHSEAVKYLKEEHGVTHGYANTIVILSKEENVSDDELVNNQYKGKENLIPVYDKLIELFDENKTRFNQLKTELRTLFSQHPLMIRVAN